MQESYFTHTSQCKTISVLLVVLFINQQLLSVQYTIHNIIIVHVFQEIKT